jgi:hypothetical protein
MLVDTAVIIVAAVGAREKLAGFSDIRPAENSGVLIQKIKYLYQF